MIFQSSVILHQHWDIRPKLQLTIKVNRKLRNHLGPKLPAFSPLISSLKSL